MVSPIYVGFVDAGFLRGEGAKALSQRASSVRTNAAAMVHWLRHCPAECLEGQSLLRTYWYDGAFDATHRDYATQRPFFEAIALTPGLQLRLGHVVEYPFKLEQPIRRALESTARALGLVPEELLAEFDRHWTFRPERQQKGVDTLITLDMVRLATRASVSSMVVVAGDRDLAEGIRTVQDYGVRVVVATPSRQSIARELAQLADDVVEFGAEELSKILPPRLPAEGPAAGGGENGVGTGAGLRGEDAEEIGTAGEPEV